MSFNKFDETAKSLTDKLKAELKRRKKEASTSQYENELAAEQAKRAEESNKLHKENKAQTHREGMSGYGSYELTMLAFLDHLMKLNIEWKKSPHYDITIQMLSKFNWLSTNLGDVFNELTAVEKKVGIEYSIDIKDGVPSFMVTSEGNKLNGDLEKEFNQLITFALGTKGYTLEDGKFKDNAKAVLTQEKFDTDIAPDFKQKLEQILEVGDLRASPGLRPL